MDTPRPRSPRPPSPLSKPTALLPTPPLPLSAAASPSRDFSFAFSSSSSPFGGNLPPLSMSRNPVGRVGSDLGHNNYSQTSRHRTTSYGTGGASKDRDRDKNRASPFFSGLGGAWRKESSSSDATGKQQAEEKRKDKAKRALDVGQWVKRYMTSMVEQLRASFSRKTERERREQRRRPHSFSGHGPNATREMRERELWRRRRGQLSSAPASLRVSPANSGHLSVGGSVKVSTSEEENTMEELQSAIEAAIAHCKNSISVAKPTTAGGETRSFSKP
ncbi:probable BRI1 kinase inhibitor 1 [Phragmites australis]|uniref:probable BRI1 kinase inhibitor 1 n=1 Tax=Phragmites australis TaxID=29695 RepID=UPI002D769DB4|nr:probable BRI1 kinase inhibitor 1 [Phragmites australis]